MLSSKADTSEIYFYSFLHKKRLSESWVVILIHLLVCSLLHLLTFDSTGYTSKLIDNDFSKQTNWEYLFSIIAWKNRTLKMRMYTDKLETMQ